MQSGIFKKLNKNKKGKKKKVKILNSFSLNMLANLDSNIMVRQISVDEARELLTDPDLGGIESAVGHADTAKVFSKELSLEIPCERKTVTLEKGSMVLVGQYRGPRLPEGATELPEGAEIIWCKVFVD